MGHLHVQMVPQKMPELHPPLTWQLSRHNERLVSLRNRRQNSLSRPNPQGRVLQPLQWILLRQKRGLLRHVAHPPSYDVSRNYHLFDQNPSTDF